MQLYDTPSMNASQIYKKVTGYFDNVFKVQRDADKLIDFLRGTVGSPQESVHRFEKGEAGEICAMFAIGFTQQSMTFDKQAVTSLILGAQCGNIFCQSKLVHNAIFVDDQRVNEDLVKRCFKAITRTIGNPSKDRPEFAFPDAVKSAITIACSDRYSKMVGLTQEGRERLLAIHVADKNSIRLQQAQIESTMISTEALGRYAIMIERAIETATADSDALEVLGNVDLAKPFLACVRAERGEVFIHWYSMGVVVAERSFSPASPSLKVHLRSVKEAAAYTDPVKIRNSQYRREEILKLLDFRG